MWFRGGMRVERVVERRGKVVEAEPSITVM